jgi:Leucine-rich repeat (LRR) protein
MIKKYNQYLKENNDYSDIDPYGEEIWDDEEELNPLLYLAKKQYKPYDQISSLSCFNENLNSLEGIEKLINLRGLYCSNNNLTNLNGIENLMNLRGLYCWSNNFSNEYKQYLKDYCRKEAIQLNT